MNTTIRRNRALILLLIIVPLSASPVFMFCAETDVHSGFTTHEEYWKNNPTTYSDVELQSEGITGLYHPFDERTGSLTGSDGKPYTGERNVYFIETDSLFYTETIFEGKVTRTTMNMYDSTGASHYKSVTIPSLDKDGNRVTTFYNDRITDSLVLSMKTIESDSLITNKAWHSNGRLAWEFRQIPGAGRHGLSIDCIAASYRS